MLKRLINITHALLLDLGATIVCQYDPSWYKSDPKSIQVDATCT